MDLAHGLGRAELGVGDIDKAWTSDEGSKRVPGRNVRRVVTRIAVGTAIGDRHRPVGTDRQDEQQLLEIGAVILVVPVRNRRGGLAPCATPVARS